MKYKGIAVFAAVLAGAAGLTGWLLLREPNRPQPVENHIGKSEKVIKRQEWIDQMHRAAPGTDWRTMDEQARMELYQNRLPELQQAARSGWHKGARMESIADGALTGQWIEKGSDNLAGRVHCVDVDFTNNRLYAASDGGQIFAGSLSGEGWTSLSDPFRISNIQFLRAFPNNAGGTRILASNEKVRMNFSDDLGVTWKISDGLSSYYSGYDLLRAVSQVDGTLYMLAYKSGYLYLFKSSDLGTNFSRIAKITGSSKSDIWTNRFGNDSLYLIDQNKVYSLQNSSELVNIATVNLSFTNDKIQQLQLAGCTVASVTKLYAMYRLENASYFYGTGNIFTSWNYRGTMEQGPFMSNSFGASPTTPNLIAFGGINACFSTNGGVNWTEVNSWGEYYNDMLHKLHADIPEIEFFKKPDGTDLVFVSTDGGTFVSNDQLNTVTNVTLKGMNVSQYYATYTHRTKTNVVYAGAQDQGFQKCFNAGDGLLSFEQTISGDYGHIVSGDNGASMWTVYPGFAMYYPQASLNNSAGTLGFDEMNMKNQFWMPPLMADPYFPNRLYVAGGSSTTGCHQFYLTYQNGAITSSELPTDFSNGVSYAKISAMACSPINKDYRYVLNSEGRFFYSTDRGSTYTMSTDRGPGSHYFYGNSIIPSPRDINTIYLAGAGYSGSPVWVSHDGGENFTAMSTGMKNSLIFEMTCNEDGTLLFAASEVGPWVYIAAKGQWYDLSGVGAPQQTYWAVDYVPALRTARFGTYGRGIWDFKIDSYNGIDEIIAGNTEHSVSVYPNPCLDRLTVKTLWTEGKTTITIMTIDGHTVQTSTQADGPSSQLNVSALPAGMYIVSVTNGSKKESVRVVKQ